MNNTASSYAPARHSYWDDKAEGDKLACGSCGKLLKVMTSGQHTKNAGRQFVSCNKDYHGCGFFCFIDEAPKSKQGAKRGRSDGGTSFTGPVTKAPSGVELRVEELCTEVASLRVSVQNCEAAMRDLIKGLRVIEEK